MDLRALSTAILTLVFGATFAVAQCRVPAPQIKPVQDVITEEQQIRLGEVLAQTHAMTADVMTDTELNGYLGDIGEKLVRQLPASKLKYSFYLLDSNEANAYVLPSGRIYVTRKLVSVFRSEDELAGVLAHEISHMTARHSAVIWTKYLREVLGMKDVPDNTDFEAVYHRFLDTWRRHDEVITKIRNVDAEQEEADALALFLMARAGYSPIALAEFWDRFAGTKGKKGSWLSDLFGTTSPDARRFRELANKARELPPSCVDQRTGSDEQFQAWKKAVQNYTPSGSVAILHDVVAKARLNPPLRGDITYIRFSPDGKYLLATDESSIFVLSRSPLKVLFRIAAEDAQIPQFTPDSQHVIFYDSGLTIEKWSIAERKRVDMRDLYLARTCYTHGLSPDGKVMLCVQHNEQAMQMDALIIDVETGKSIATKSRIFAYSSIDSDPVIRMPSYAFHLDDVRLPYAFSPDGHYLLIRGVDELCMFDLVQHKRVESPASIKYAVSFAFLDNERLLVVDGTPAEARSFIASITSGKVLSDRKLAIYGDRNVMSVTKGDYALVWPLLKAPVGVFDAKLNAMAMGSNSYALDVYDGTVATQGAGGELLLYASASGPPITQLQLPTSPLPRDPYAYASPDLKLIAISSRSRGAVFDATSGQRKLYVQGFQAVDFDADKMHLNLRPVSEFDGLRGKEQSRKDFEMSVAGSAGNVLADGALDGNLTTTKTYPKKSAVWQFGRFVTVREYPDLKNRSTINYEVNDARTGKTLWNRKFTKREPRKFGEPGTDLMGWFWDLPESMDELQKDPALKAAYTKLGDKDAGLLDIVDMRTGSLISRTVLDTGNYSFVVKDGALVGDRIVLIDNMDRQLVYDKSGRRLGQIFGTQAAYSKDGKLLAVQRDPGHVYVYSLTTMKPVDDFTFDARVLYASFSEDGSRLIVLTRNHWVYTLGLGATLAQK